MKNPMTTIVVAAALAAAVSAQHVKVFDGHSSQTGAHGSGGGGGAGKVSMRDFSIAPIGNTVVAFPASFRGGVRVAVGDVNGDGQALLTKLAQSSGRSGGTFTLTFNGQTTTPVAKKHSQNNLKQIGLAMHQLEELRIGFLKPAGAGAFQEFASFRLSKVRMQPAGEGKKVRIDFVKVEKGTAIGSANGGVWKTTDYVNPQSGETMIGLLLPAVQKIR